MELKKLHFLGLLLGLFFALEPSYIHPDEHFQGLNIVLSKISSINSYIPWEFELQNGSRSYLPIFIHYGPVVVLNKYVLHLKSATGLLYLARLQNYAVFVLASKLALQFLVVGSKFERTKADFLISTSYIFWTYQTHTFSNSTETIILLTVTSLWKALLRDSRNPIFQHFKTSALLGILISFGIFNRITFPAFLFLPGLLTLKRFYLHHLRSLLVCAFFFVLASLFTIAFDTYMYGSENWCITPLNNLRYNTDAKNLAQHGLHPRITHLLVNLPQIMGPMVFFIFKIDADISRLVCFSGLALLSIFQHQELRFLVPLLPFLCISVDLSSIRKVVRPRILLIFWFIFNIIMGIVMGSLHQRGVIDALQRLTSQETQTNVHVWWKTYPPPTWMYLSPNLTVSVPNQSDGQERVGLIDFSVLQDHVVDLMGCDVELLALTLSNFFLQGSAANITLISPTSMSEDLSILCKKYPTLEIKRTWHSPWNLDLDHLDFGRSLLPITGIDIHQVSKKSNQ
ncbi:LAMI_0D10594g1_1 [Lachancea mirantina]|uniref:Mannosyltransferase n=1 Tax=Lachancea mirantina TaxID=1230905 RepID=A0A1G4JEM9_9SACH|nr:LAMI_0D10594g1_1 [Lachancea mirantina]